WTIGVPHGRRDIAYAMASDFARRVRAQTQGVFQIDVVALRDVGVKSSEALLTVQQGRYDGVLIWPEHRFGEPLFAAVFPHCAMADAHDNVKLAPLHLQVTRQALVQHDLDVAAIVGDRGERGTFILSRRPFASLEELAGRRLWHWSPLAPEAL